MRKKIYIILLTIILAASCISVSTAADANWDKNNHSQQIPQPELVFPDQGKTFATSSPLLIISVNAYTELKDDVKIKINKKPVNGKVEFTNSNNKATILVQPENLNDGVNSIEVKVKDISGNQLTEEWTFNVSEKPVVIETVPVNGGTIAKNGTISFELADNGSIDPDSILLQIDGIRVEHSYDETTGIVSYNLSNMKFPQAAAMFSLLASDYQPILTSTLINDSHIATITASDSSGNILTASLNFNILSTGLEPSLSFNYPGAVIDTGSPDLIITVKSNSAANVSTDNVVKVDGVIVSTDLQFQGHYESDSCGSWWVVDSYQEAAITYHASDLTDGPHIIEVTAKDIAGNISTQSWSFSVAEPAKFDSKFPNGITNINNAVSVRVTDNDPIDPSSIVLKVDGMIAAHSYDSTAKTISYQPGAPLADGSHTVWVSAKGTGSGITGSSSWSYTIETSGPELTFSDTGESYPTGSPQLVVTATTSISDLANYNLVKVDGVIVSADLQFQGHWESDSCGSWWVIDSYKGAAISYQASGLRDGPHTIEVTAKDNLGNTATRSWTFNVAEPPAFDNKYPTGVTNINNAVSVRVTDNDPIDPSSIVLKVDGMIAAHSYDSTAKTISYQPGAPLADGSHTVWVSAKGTGSGITGSSSWSYTIETSGPELTFAGSGTTFTTASPNLVVTAKTIFNNIVNYSIVKIDGVIVTAAFEYPGHWESDSCSEWWVVDSYKDASFTCQASGLMDGAHTLEVTAKDAAGNITIAQWTFYVDTSASRAVRFSTANYAVTEGDPVTITVQRTGALLNNPSTVILSTADNSAIDNSAIAGEDYAPLTQTISFNAEETTKTVIISTLDDISFEGAEEFKVTLSSPGGCVLGSINSAAINISDNDSKPEISFTTEGYTVDEGDTVTVTVSRTGSIRGASAVNYAASAGTAGLTDYIPTAGTLNFGPGESAKTFTVITNSDLEVEGDETVNISLTAPVNADLAAPAAAVLTIIDTTPLPVIEVEDTNYSMSEGGSVAVTLTRSAIGTVSTVDYTSSDITAAAGSDYSPVSGTITFAAGELSQAITLTSIDDGIFEPDENFSLTLSSPTNAELGTNINANVIIVENDAPPLVEFVSAAYSTVENAGVVTVTVQRAAAAVTSTVAYAAIDGTGEAGADYTMTSGTLTFNPGELVKSFDIQIINDTLYEYEENFYIALSNPVMAALGTQNITEITITDDDPAPFVQFESAVYSVDEGDSVVVTLTRTGGTDVVSTIDYSTSDGTAVADLDYTASSGTVTFNVGEAAKTITISTHDDSLFEANETITLVLTNPLIAAVGTPAAAQIMIKDNELSLIAFSSASYEVAEGDTITVTVIRTGDTANSADVSYAAITGGTAAAGVDYTPVSGTLTFNPGETSKTFSISSIHDTRAEFNESVNIELLSCSGSALEGTDARKSAVLTILDDDSPSENIVDLQFSSPSFVAVPVGATTETYLYGIDNNGESADITQISTWSSSNPEVATANAGKITGRGIGTTVVSAKYNSLVKQITVVVR
ncbi:Calx-beta domain-containing protein [Phosphitispora fastidiosa]|uniref:Calx-beta domain-containing protein n=1 Tax=Phosphitispora fastidiosa TaxID=2837202 RepID=UPI001E3BC5D3|nr:Calx-beta domain-containing protein [Phosphitispora fastidiosa]MBU7005194.1 hypothetical protein [Phosphitispora fastidiosa]